MRNFQGYKQLWNTLAFFLLLFFCFLDNNTFAFHSARFIGLDIYPSCIKQSSHLYQNKSVHLKDSVKKTNIHTKLYQSAI